MKNHKKNTQIFSISLLTVLVCSSFLMVFAIWSIRVPVNSEEQAAANPTNTNSTPKISGDFNASVEIYIKNNWTETEDTEDWCTGNGTDSDPFLIDGLEINGGEENVCLVIQDTVENFTVKNCTFMDSAEGNNYGGLVLNNVTKGNISDNKIYSNSHGIWLYNTSDMIIEENRIINNTESGIYMEKSESVDILGNLIKNCSESDGIRLNDTSSILIEDNRISNNKKNGIYLAESQDVDIFDNIVKKNTEDGIFLSNSESNNMSYNIIHINTLYGVHLDSKSDNNGLRENYLGYNTKGCWKDEGSENIFTLNDCIGNYEEEPVYDDYEPTDLTPIIIGVGVTLAIILGLIIFAKFGFPVLKEKFLDSSRESSEKELQKQV
ncbi:MAG: right-handed parallel beta-helix repeat-containing protein [Promethearchaeia archaeon]